MLFKQQFHEPVRRGDITMAFRRWKRPTVRPGGQLMTPIGVLAIDAVDEITLADVTETDLRNAGSITLDELLSSLPEESPDRRLYRVRFHWLGDDPRHGLAGRSTLDDEERRDLARRLTHLDRTSRTGPWTTGVLQMIGERPGEASRVLAERLGVEQALLKRRIRRLKALGLTKSLGTGYQLSERGSCLLRDERDQNQPGSDT